MHKNRLLLSLITAITCTSAALADPRGIKVMIEAFNKGEYRYGNTRLIRLETFSHESDEPRFEGSSCYHAIRNGLTLKGYFDCSGYSTGPLGLLLDTKDLKEKLAVNGEWRSLIRNRRAGTETGKLTFDEMAYLISSLKVGTTKSLPKDTYIFSSVEENRQNGEPTINLNDDKIKALKARLKKEEDFAALIFVSLKTSRQVTSKQQMGPIEIPVTETVIEHEGEWAALIIDSRPGLRRYLLADSGDNKTIFTQSGPVKELVEKFEGSVEKFARFPARNQQELDKAYDADYLGQVSQHRQRHDVTLDDDLKKAVNKDVNKYLRKNETPVGVMALYGVATGLTCFGCFLLLQRHQTKVTVQHDALVVSAKT